ncbi:MAG: hypothetical protein U0871_23855 [Gemmataceae bacterium]
MAEGTAMLRGWVRNGAIILEPGTALPDGAEVRLTVVPEAERGPIPFTPEEAAEFAGWELIGDEAWAMIDEWEKEGGDAAG